MFIRKRTLLAIPAAFAGLSALFYLASRSIIDRVLSNDHGLILQTNGYQLSVILARDLSLYLLLVFVSFLLISCIIAFLLFDKSVRKSFQNLSADHKIIAESEARYRALFENAPIIIFSTRYSPDGEVRITSLNPSFEAITGWKCDDWIGKPVRDLIHPDDIAKAVEIARLTGTEITPSPYELRIRIKSGVYRTGEFISTPMKVNGAVVGGFGLAWDTTGRKLVEESLRRRADELSVLHAVAEAGAEAVDEDVLIERATEVIGEILFPEQFGVLLLNTEGTALSTHFSYRNAWKDRQNSTFPVGKGVTGRVAATGLPWRIQDVRLLEEYIDASTRPMTSEVCVPLKLGDRVIGVINAESARKDAFTEADENILTTLAGQLATAIERLRVEAAERQQAQQLAAIYEVGKEIVGASLYPEQVYLAIHKAVGTLMPSEAFVIALLDEHRPEIELVYLIDRSGRYPAQTIPPDRGLSGKVISSGETILIDDYSLVADEMDAVHFGDDESVRSILAVPMRLAGKVIGMLSTQSYQPYAYTVNDVRMLELLTAHAVIALGNARLFREKYHQALTFENMFDAVILTDISGTITDWNQAAVRMFGYERKDVLGQSPSVIHVPEDRPYLEEEITRTVVESGRWDGEVRFVRQDGVEGVAEVVVVPIKDETGAVTGTVGVNRDITGRKRYEAVQGAIYKISEAANATDRIEDLYRDIHSILSELMPARNIYFAIYDESTQLIQFPYYVDEYDPQPEPQKLGRGLTEYVLRSGEPLLATPQGFQDLLDRGEVELVGSSSLDWIGVPLKVGEKTIGVLVLQSYTPGVRYGEKELEILQFVSNQVALAIYRKRSEEAISESEKRYRSLFEHSPISLWEEDLSEVKRYLQQVSANANVGDYSAYLNEHPEIVAECVKRIRILDVNYSTLKLFGSASKEELITRMAQLVDDESQELLIKELAAICEGKTEFEGEGIRYDQQGNPVSVRLHLSVAPGSEDSLSDVIISMFDITERVQRERELEVVAGVSSALRVASERSEMYPVLLEQLQSLLCTKGSCLALVDPISKERVIELAHGDWAMLTGKRLQPGTGLLDQIINSKQLFQTASLLNGAQWMDMDELRQDYAAAITPLVAQDQCIGTLWVGRDKVFSEQDLRILTSVANIAANAIHRSTLLELTKSHVIQMGMVNAIGRALSETHDLGEIYMRTAHGIYDLLSNIATVFVSMFDSEERVIKCAYGIQDGIPILVDDLPALPLLPPGEGLQSQVIHSRKPLIINNLLAELRKARTVVEVGSSEAKTQSAIYIPMIFKDEILGIIQAQSYLPNRFGQADAELLILLANTAAIAIENARLFSETELRLRHLAALRAMDIAISSSFDLRVTLSVLLDQVTAQLNVDAAAVLLFNTYTQMLEYVLGRGFHTNGITTTRMRLGEDLPGRAALEGRIISTDDTPPALLRHIRLSGEGFVSYYGVPLIAKGQVKGVLEIFHRSKLNPDPEWFEFLETLAGDTAIAVDSASLFNELQRSNTELMLAYDTTLEGWSRALELRDRETEGHTQRVADLTVRLGQLMGVGDAELVHLRRGAFLHDIGKMGVPDAILLKPGPLSPEEWEIMRLHPVYAYKMLSPIAYLRQALDIPYYHHERWDGTGYPHGLKGEQIPLAARIFSVIDVWDALQSERPYRSPWNDKEVLAYIQAQAGSQFDPCVVRAFTELVSHMVN